MISEMVEVDTLFLIVQCITDYGLMTKNQEKGR